MTKIGCPSSNGNSCAHYEAATAYSRRQIKVGPNNTLWVQGRAESRGWNDHSIFTMKLSIGASQLTLASAAYLEIGSYVSLYFRDLTFSATHMLSVSTAQCRKETGYNQFWGTLVLKAQSDDNTDDIDFDSAVCFDSNISGYWPINIVLANDGSSNEISIFYEDKNNQKSFKTAFVDLTDPTVKMSVFSLSESFDFMSATNSPSGGSTRASQIVLKFKATPQVYGLIMNFDAKVTTNPTLKLLTLSKATTSSGFTLHQGAS